VQDSHLTGKTGSVATLANCIASWAGTTTLHPERRGGLLMPDGPRQIRWPLVTNYMTARTQRLRRAGLPGYICRWPSAGGRSGLERLRRRVELRRPGLAGRVPPHPSAAGSSLSLAHIVGSPARFFLNRTIIRMATGPGRDLPPAVLERDSRRPGSGTGFDWCDTPTGPGTWSFSWNHALMDARARIDLDASERRQRGTERPPSRT